MRSADKVSGAATLSSTETRRRAFTLVELLVVVGITGMLMGLLLAAVQRVREAALRARCCGQLRQVGMAVIHFHDTNGFFPNSGGLPKNGLSTPKISTAGRDRIKTWGVGDPRVASQYQPGPWAYSILPYLESDAAYRERLFAVAVPVYICPSRGRQNPQAATIRDPVFKGWSYASGGVNPWGKIDYAANLQVSLGSYATTVQTGRVLCIAEITDGTTNTILAGEKSADLRAYETGGWLWDEPIFAGGAAGGTVRSGASVQLDRAGVDFADNWGSAHVSGTNFVFADGSVRLIRFGTGKSVMQTLLTPAGGEPQPGFDQ